MEKLSTIFDSALYQSTSKEKDILFRSLESGNPEIWNDWLKDCSFSADLRGIDLSHCILRGMCFKDVNLKGACFVESDLSGTDLSGADLSTADLTGANLQGANLNRTNLSKAILRGITVEAHLLINAILSKAFIKDVVFK